MSKFKNWTILAVIVLLVLAVNAANVEAGAYDMQGLVYIDTNLNGTWEPGEPGYDGVWQWVADEELFRYVGATVTVITPAYDEYELETAGYKEPDEGKDVACTRQDLVLADDVINPNPMRPCSGTWGLPVSVEDVFMVVELTVPEGYYATSETRLTCYTGEDAWMDFGIAPLADGEGGMGGQTSIAVQEETAVSEPVFQMEVTGTGFVPGLVFIDDNLDGVWQPGEAGYGGALSWIEDEGVTRYVGATITLISPAYDEWDLTSAGYREPKEGTTVACTQQDLIIDGEFNPHPMRPCSGTWGMGHAGDDVRWEVWLTAPDGYTITSSNPQYYVTGSGQMPVDFGITPID